MVNLISGAVGSFGESHFKICSASSGFVNLSSLAVIRNSGLAMPSQMRLLSKLDSPDCCTRSSCKTIADVIVCQTADRDCLLKRSCSALVSSSAFWPAIRNAEVLLMPPRRSNIRRTANIGEGIRARFLICLISLSEKGDDLGQIATMPMIWSQQRCERGELDDASRAARVQP